MSKKQKPWNKKKQGPRVMRKTKVTDTNSKDFAALQKRWYDKLATDGFDDIEWTDHATGKGQNTSYLKRPAGSVARQYDPLAEDHYRFCRNYISHMNITDRLERFICEQYTEGFSYRKIIKQIKGRGYAKVPSIFFVWQVIDWFKKEVMEWNKTDPEGCLNEGNQDFVVRDIILGEENE